MKYTYDHIQRGFYLFLSKNVSYTYLGTSYIASAKTWRRTLARVVLLVCDYVLDLYARYVSKYIATYLCQPHNRHHTPNQLASTQIFFFFFSLAPFYGPTTTHYFVELSFSRSSPRRKKKTFNPLNLRANSHLYYINLPTLNCWFAAHQLPIPP